MVLNPIMFHREQGPVLDAASEIQKGVSLRGQMDKRSAKKDIMGALERGEISKDDAALQFMAYDPQIATGLSNMAQNEQRAGVLELERRKKELELGAIEREQQRQQQIQVMNRDKSMINHTLSTISGLESSEQKSKVWRGLQEKYANEGMPVPQVLQGGWDDDKDEILQGASQLIDIRLQGLQNMDPNRPQMTALQRNAIAYAEDPRVKEFADLQMKTSSMKDAEAADDISSGLRQIASARARGKEGIEQTEQGAIPEEGLAEARGELASKEEMAKKIGKDSGQRIVEMRGKAMDAREGLFANSQARNLLDQGVITGTGAEFRVGLGKALRTFGFNQDDDDVANSEAFIAQRASEVANIIQAFGAGTGLSDADRAFAEKAAGGLITMDEQSIRKILDINDRAYRRAIELYNEEVGKIPQELQPYNLSVEVDTPERKSRTPEGLGEDPLTLF